MVLVMQQDQRHSEHRDTLVTVGIRRRGSDPVVPGQPRHASVIGADAVGTVARRLGARAAACRLDIREPDGWVTAFDAAETQFGPVDILVNNAGSIHTGHARNLSLQQHRDIVEVNLLGTMAGVHTALPRMTERGRGHVITICSMTAVLALPGYATYGGTKHAILAFHHAVALEERHGPLHFTILHPPSAAAAANQHGGEPGGAVVVGGEGRRGR
jgi:NADP-dependent 3-hydroxy acid dehydrogenase YdfG